MQKQTHMCTRERTREKEREGTYTKYRLGMFYSSNLTLTIISFLKEKYTSTDTVSHENVKLYRNRILFGENMEMKITPVFIYIIHVYMPGNLL